MEALIGLLSGLRVGILRFDLLVEFRGLSGIGGAVVVGEGQEHNGLGHKNGGLVHELLVELDGMGAATGLLVVLRELETRKCVETLIAGRFVSLQFLFRFGIAL